MLGPGQWEQRQRSETDAGGGRGGIQRFTVTRRREEGGRLPSLPTNGETVVKVKNPGGGSD